MIVLVRHGQASWGAADYDVLSPLGEEQSAVVGTALAGLHPDLVVHGTMKRQRQTAELAVAAAGWNPPSGLVVDPAWDEMDHLALLAATPREFEGEPDRQQFQQWFEAATDRWTGGGEDGDYDESFPDFSERVRLGLARLSEAGTVVVFTSGGPIAAVTSALLGAGTASYRKLAKVVVNTSVTRVVSGRRGLTLLSFNEHSHLSQDQITYR